MPARPEPAGNEPTALERHASFFDRDGDGIIRTSDTRIRLRELGLGGLWSIAIAFVIHLFLGFATSGPLSLEIRVRNIKKGKHPSETGIFDTDGRLDAKRFDRMFAEAAGNDDQGRPSRTITLAEFRRFVTTHGKQSAFFDLFAAGEAKLLFCIARDAKKLEGGAWAPAMKRRTLLSFYEGKLLYAVVRLRRTRR